MDRFTCPHCARHQAPERYERHLAICSKRPKPDLWMQRLHQLVDNSDKASRGFASEIGQLAEDVARIGARLEGLQERVTGQQKQFLGKAGKLIQRRADAVVITRNYGAQRQTYHSIDRPCGWVPDQWGGRYRRLLLSEATASGLRPCSSCGARID